jgi:hypothetical protein
MSRTNRCAASVVIVAAAWLCCSPAHALWFGTYGNWDTQARRDAANASMTAVVNRFNTYGDFDWGSDGWVDVYYNAGVPTAQANYYGSIDFGGTWPNERVTQHELNHWLGSGTYWNWGNQFNNNVWTGPRVAQLVQQFDGQGAAFRRSGVHFYPYGLNYDSEVVNDSIYMRNVALMYAMRQDMGNGNPNNPWSATEVTLVASDPVGTSAFNWYGGGWSRPDYQGWSDNHFAHPGADYSTGNFILRTPLDTYNPAAATPSFRFAGDSLTINNTNGAQGGLLFAGVGRNSVITINDLVLDGGYVRHARGASDFFQLAGNITVVGSPTIDAAQGDIRVLSTIGGSGHLTLRGGFTKTLVSQLNNYQGDTHVLAGTLSLEGSTGQGTTTIAGGARLVGDGRVGGNLVALPSATIRVGAAGLPVSLPGGTALVDNFEQYAVGPIGAVPNTTGNVWTGVFDGTANAEIVSTPSSRALRVRGINSGGNAWRGAVTSLSNSYASDHSLDHGETGTYFFRVRRNGTGFIDAIFGLSDQAASTSSGPGADTASPWDEYAVLLSIFGESNSSMLRGYSDGSGDISFAPLTNGQWTNVWLTVDNAAKTYRVATSVGDTEAFDSGYTFNFGRRTAGLVGSNPLATFGIHEWPNSGVEIDDLYFTPGASLANPLALAATLNGEVLTVAGDMHLQSGATLQVDLGLGAADRVVVRGVATLEGTIAVTVDGGYTPQLNDSFTLLVADNIAGMPTLGGSDALAFSLAASTSTQLILTAVSGLAGDFNNDGAVDAADYTVWRDSVGGAAGSLLNDTTHTVVGEAQYAIWRANFGRALPPMSSLLAAAAVPEPTTLALLLLGLTIGGVCQRRAT